MGGKWVVFEGVDGAGTTTQCRLLVERLERELENGRRVFATAEPTEGPFGAICRSALRGGLPLDRRSLALAFTADRSHHLYREDGILVRVEQGDWVVQDRYLYSTLAYQDGEDRDWLDALNSLFPRPDLVVFLDTPVEVCLERISRRGKSAEIFEREEALARVSENYKAVIERETSRARWLLLDGAAPALELHERTFDVVSEWL
ncbi:MAG: dTMP kinase [Candidatus Omnitrophica bacterium]|nr:dTMP kinase [Candidatus Omnitrophota bacterium]